jgi:hypothetical protein
MALLETMLVYRLALREGRKSKNPSAVTVRLDEVNFVHIE